MVTKRIPKDQVAVSRDTRAAKAIKAIEYLKAIQKAQKVYIQQERCTSI